MRLFYSILGTLALVVATGFFFAAFNLAHSATDARDMLTAASVMAFIGIGFMVGAAAYRPDPSTLRPFGPPVGVPAAQPGWAAMPPDAPAQPRAAYQPPYQPGT
jgi:hypothetical protein